ncbi:hypothetical protein EMIT0P44_30318 [Pseudomonas sp. IT-P44]
MNITFRKHAHFFGFVESLAAFSFCLFQMARYRMTPADLVGKLRIVFFGHFDALLRFSLTG